MIFSKFENMVAGRYLRAKRKEGFISVITSFAFIGIALGVATLIIVTSVMNGFKAELLGRILGINGHISIQPSAIRRLTTIRKRSKPLKQKFRASTSPYRWWKNNCSRRREILPRA